MSSTLYGLARIGRDTELRHTAQGEAIANLSLAFAYGRKGADGKTPTQWLEGAMWGKRAEALAQHLVKGTSVMVTLNDVHVESFTKQDGTVASKLVGRVADIEFAGAPVARPAAPPPPPPKPAPAASGFEDMDSDIPFRDPMSYRGAHLVL
jgi:single-strand DNA-binding protein